MSAASMGRGGICRSCWVRLAPPLLFHLFPPDSHCFACVVACVQVGQGPAVPDSRLSDGPAHLFAAALGAHHVLQPNQGPGPPHEGGRHGPDRAPGAVRRAGAGQLGDQGPAELPWSAGGHPGVAAVQVCAAVRGEGGAEGPCGARATAQACTAPRRFIFVCKDQRQAVCCSLLQQNMGAQWWGYCSMRQDAAAPEWWPLQGAGSVIAVMVLLVGCINFETDAVDALSHGLSLFCVVYLSDGLRQEIRVSLGISPVLCAAR